MNDLDGTLLSNAAKDVAVAWGPTNYPGSAPYSPAMRFPEYRFDDAAVAGDANAADKPADVYATVRESMHLLGLDPERFGTAQWNPLAGIVRPGDTVVIKPNLVREFRETHGGHDDCLITHGAVIRAAVDYVFIALSGKGRIVIADAPHSDADFDAVAAIAGLRELQAFYHRAAGFEVEVYDLRPERAEKIDGVIVAHKALPGDPAGYARADLGARSAFAEIEPLCKLLYGSEYDTSELYAHHRGGVHEYLISRTVLSADCVISLPKLKTHKKTGITVNMKNLVGINGNKNWLPHHREGTPSQGGDQFADDGLKRRVERSAVMRFKRLFPLLGPLRPMVAGPIKAVGKRLFGDTNTGTIRSGNWYGNDTTWRMVIDLNRILHYADANGVLHDRPLRRFFSVVDGIVAGEGNGPLDPTAKPCGVVVAGRNPVTVDLVCARLMGFDYRRLPVLNRALAPHDRPLAMLRHDVVRMQSNNSRYEGPVAAFRGPALAFRPHFGWRGAVECEDDWTGKSR